MRAEWKQIDDEQCRLFHASVELIGRRWSSAILLALSRGAYRFSEIHASVPGLSDRMLAQRLRLSQNVPSPVASGARHGAGAA